MVKKVVVGVVVLVLLAIGGGAGWAMMQASAFDASMSARREFPIPEVVRSTDPAVLARGKHLAESIGGCTACHGADLSGKVEDMGPVGTFAYPNLTPGKSGVLADYSDGELARLLRHGIKRDGSHVLMMPVFEWFWWPEADRTALISYLRTLPPVDTQPLRTEIGTFAKVLDRIDSIPLDVVRRTDHDAAPSAVAPAATAEYGKLLAHGCGCHGVTMSGGPIPGAPPDLPPPRNLTPHESGLKGWTFADFDKLMRTAIRPDGTELHPFMPVVAYSNMNETEMQALWAYLQSLPPTEYGGR